MSQRNPESIHPATLPNRKSIYKSSKEEQEGRQIVLERQLLVWRSQLPQLMKKFAQLPDLRRPGSIRHKSVVLMTFALFLFVFEYASRREANRELTHPSFWELLQAVFPEIESIPHMDTVNRFLEKTDPAHLEEILLQTIKRLLRNGKLRGFLVNKQYVVAIDGTQKLARRWQWADEALHKRYGDNESYAAYALEAVIVNPQGMAIPFLTEFCENSSGGEALIKQDCELKACKRLLIRMRKVFPKLRLMVVVDGLYPNGPIMALCRQLRLDFMIVLPQDCLRSVWDEVEGLKKLEKDQTRTYCWGNREQVFWWVNHIDYDFQENNSRRRLKLHVAGCTESWEENGKNRESHWTWVSSQPLTKQNIVIRCNRMARQRWNIEENILIEKHHGYQYEHAFSLNWTAMKNWHLIMHLGHLINILALHTEVLIDKVRELGIRGTLRFLRKSWINQWIDPAKLKTFCTRSPRLNLIIQ
ncbi:MAG: transposase family protein [Candidatus Methanofastidiosum sp.]|nr:transposase family protein [Methanofastidiosum sp.]